MKVHIVLFDIAGTEWVSDFKELDEEEVSIIVNLLENFSSLKFLLLTCQGKDWYFNPRNIVCVRLVVDE